jgi:tRNA dimethylallyltransferase
MSSSDASAGGKRDGGGGSLPVLRVICGPTAAGKSGLALALAARHPIAILSADSRQVYRGFDVGTAKPSAAERAAVPHYGVDVADPEERYSAAQWAGAADGWVRDALASGREPLVVGGTGFYLRALFNPLFDAPSLDPARRAALDEVVGALPVPELRRWCERLDPERAPLGRTQLLRSIETALLLGRRLSDLQREAPRAPRYAARYLVVDPGSVLADRIAARVDAMLDCGWVEETRGLAARVAADAPAWNASGYATVRRLASGELRRDEARHLVTLETRQYAKRQRTWFRHQLAGEVTVVDPGDAHALERAEAWWSGGGRSAA